MWTGGARTQHPVLSPRSVFPIGYNIDFIILDPPAVHPESESAEAALLGEIFRHPCAMRAERFGKVLHQRGEKLLAGFRRSAFENRAEGGVGFNILERRGSIGWLRGHGGKYETGGNADSRG